MLNVQDSLMQWNCLKSCDMWYNDFVCSEGLRPCSEELKVPLAVTCLLNIIAPDIK